MRVAVLLLVSGCHWVFALEETERVEPRTVSIAYSRGWIDHERTLHVDAVSPEITAQTREGTPITPTATGVGTAEFITDAATYQVTTRSPLTTFDVQAGGPSLVLREYLLGRPERMPPAAGTRIGFSLAPTVLGNAWRLYTTGLWGVAGLDSPNQDLDYTTVTALDGTLGLLSDTTDRLYVVEYGFNAVAGITEITGAFTRAVTLVDGGGTAVTGTLVAPPKSDCVRITAQLKQEGERLRRVAPGRFDTPTHSWLIQSFPSTDLPVLGQADMASATGDLDVTDKTVDFAKVIPGATSVLLAATRTRRFSLPDTTNEITLVYRSRLWSPFVDSATGCPAVSLLAGQIGLIDSIRIGNTTLIDDFAEVPLEDLEIDWSRTPQPIDFFTVVLVEVFADAGKTRTRIVATITTTEEQAVVRSRYLERGKSYYLVVQANLGAPNAQAGDFATIGPTRAAAFASSAVFTIR